LHALTPSSGDVLVSFDIVSAMEQIEQDFPLDIAKLFRHCLTTSYFQWQGEFFEQNDGVAMGSPLSPVIANYFMETFEVNALATKETKVLVSIRWRYLCSLESRGIRTAAIHGTSKFLINPRIQFTMQTEKEGLLPFLDVMVTKKPNETLWLTRCIGNDLRTIRVRKVV